MYRNRLASPLGFLSLSMVSQFALATHAPMQQPQIDAIEEIRVWGKQQTSQQAGYTTPTSLLTPADLISINIATTEDVVKYEPSIVIRRRFIGDANGTLGIRGANMFQTSRSMVFADGVPLHYFLQSRWNGSPRWTMVSASEIARVEVLYGPFSAEYSGNAMGGVVLIETAIPQERELHIDGSFFTQSFNAYGFDDEVNGFKGFMSYGDKVGDFSYYLSYNHLDNESQPQTFYYGGIPAANASFTPVTGAVHKNDEYGNRQLFFGDTGIVDSSTDNYKFKAGYDFGNWATLLNIAYEDRDSNADSANSYVKDSTGDKVWSGTFVQDGIAFSIPASRLNVSNQNRQSLSVGLRLKGSLSDNMVLEANINQFDILKDETRNSATNPQDSNYTTAGQVIDYGNTGWQTADVKLTASNLGISEITLISGLRYEAYELNTNVYNSANYFAGSKDALSNSSGGQTDIAAMFMQLNWDITAQWDMSLGGRYEFWESENGYYFNKNIAEKKQVPRQSDNRLSPKFSVGFKPDTIWTFRYSFAKAYRFPIVEELFTQFEAANSISIANPDLNPEDGTHHNLLIEHSLDEGYFRINFFQESVRDAIEAQYATAPGGGSITVFEPIDKVNTKGVEFIVNSANILINNLDLRFNLVYTDSEIVDYKSHPELEGNKYPRMPEWRGNILATYHITRNWDVGGNVQYASDSYGQIDNTDEEDNVYGAQDAYTRVGLKTGYNINQHAKIAFGVDNLTNEVAYVAHPWPGRTFYLHFSYDL